MENPLKFTWSRIFAVINDEVWRTVPERRCWHRVHWQNLPRFHIAAPLQRIRTGKQAILIHTKYMSFSHSSLSVTKKYVKNSKTIKTSQGKPLSNSFYMQLTLLRVADHRFANYRDRELCHYFRINKNPYILICFLLYFFSFSPPRNEALNSHEV